MKRRVFFEAVLLLAAAVGISVLSSVLWAAGNRRQDFERVRAVQEAQTSRLLQMDGVVGTAVGYNRRKEWVVKVFTARSSVVGIPERLDGVAVDVVVSGEIYALTKADNPAGEDKGKKRKHEPVDPKGRFSRPVPIGVSSGHFEGGAGTIGCRVTDGTNIYALSNNHVYAKGNEGVRGDAVVQPGSADGGESPADNIGTLFDFEPIDYDGNPNIMDAAIALSSGRLLGNATPADGYGLPKSTPVDAKVRMAVMKYGKTTGQTRGRIEAINGCFIINYILYGPAKTALFTGQIVISGNMSQKGDSGSLVVVRNGKDARSPVGLLFAGSEELTLANPIGAVLDRFGVSVDGE